MPRGCTRLVVRCHFKTDKNMSLTVTEKYNGSRPKNVSERDCDMLRKHWSQVQNDVLCFGAIFTNTHKTSSSGHNLADIVMKRKNLFFLELRGFASSWTTRTFFKGAPNWAAGSSLQVVHSTSQRAMSINVNTAEKNLLCPQHSKSGRGTLYACYEDGSTRSWVEWICSFLIFEF